MKTKIFTLLLLALPFFISAQTLTIDAGATVTIAPGASMTTGTITNNAGAAGLVIKADDTGRGSLIYDGTSGNPLATVETHIKKNQQTFVGTTVTPATSASFYFPNQADAWLFYWDHSVNNNNDANWAAPWTSIIAIDTALQMGRGYTYAWTDPQSSRDLPTVVQTGTLQGTDLVYNWPTAYNADNQFRLLSNPFTASISLAPFAGQDDDLIEITVWIWDQDLNGGVGGYQWASANNTYPPVAEMSPPRIPAGQAFFLRQLSANSTGVNFNADFRFHDNSFFKKSEKVVNEDLNYAWIHIESGDYHDQALIGFGENGTEGFENGWDASKMFNGENAAGVYFMDDTEWPLCQNHLSTLGEDETRIVQLYTHIGIDGEHTITADLNALKDTKVSLEDTKTGQWQDLNENATYSFSGSKDDDINRFLLHFAYSPTSIDNPFAEKEELVNIYAWDKAVYINNKDNQFADATISIYDMYGRQIYQSESTLSTITRIPMSVSNSYLVVRVLKGNATYTEKVFIK